MNADDSAVYPRSSALIRGSFSVIPERAIPPVPAQFLLELIAEGRLIAHADVRLGLLDVADAGDDGRHRVGHQRELELRGGQVWLGVADRFFHLFDPRDRARQPVAGEIVVSEIALG